MASITDQYERVLALLDDPSRSTDLKTDANNVLQLVRSDLYEIRNENGRVNHLLRYIQREADKYRATDVNTVPYDELRPSDEPLCTCRSQSCPLKQGRLPTRIQNSDTLSQDLRAYRQSHAGSPRVLNEADEAFREKVRRVDDALTLLMVSLRNQVEFTNLQGSQRFTNDAGEVPSQADRLLDDDGGGSGVEA